MSTNTAEQAGKSLQSQNSSVPARDPIRIIVCCDGTWQERQSVVPSGRSSDGKWYTNVALLSRAILPIAETDQGAVRQIVYYQSGVGTTDHNLANLLAGATGDGLADKIQEAYGFICDNYMPGDSLYLFGFSRGAYTARCIGGFINWAGLLTKRQQESFAQIFDAYQRRDPQCPVDEEAADRILFEKTGFWPSADATATSSVNNAKQAGSNPSAANLTPASLKAREPKVTPPTIKCIGVWDTVGALGVPGQFMSPEVTHFYNFYDPGLGANVEMALHAIGLAEDRKDFSVTRFYQPPGRKEKLPNQILKQVWFPGTHSDVGGGWVWHGLSDITLAWMISELVDVQGGPLLAIDIDMVKSKMQDRRKAWAKQEEHPTRLALEYQRTRQVQHEPMSKEFLSRVVWANMVAHGSTNESLHPSVIVSGLYDPKKSPQFEELRARNPALLAKMFGDASDIGRLGKTEELLRWNDAEPDMQPASAAAGDDEVVPARHHPFMAWAGGIKGSVTMLVHAVVLGPVQLVAYMLTKGPTPNKNLKPGPIGKLVNKARSKITRSASSDRPTPYDDD